MIFARMQMISQAIWEPLGIVFAVALGGLVLRFLFGGTRRSLWAWFLVAGGIYAFFWRHGVNAHGVRYHNIFLFIALFGIIGFWEALALPYRWKNLLFAALLALCIGRDLMFNPQDFEIRELYRKIRQDALQYPRILGVDYGSNAIRDAYYTKLPVIGVERPITLAHLLKNLQGNLSVYDGDFDAVYLFFMAKKDEFSHLDHFLTLAPDGHVEKIGECLLDGHNKKKLAVFRYRPAPHSPPLAGGGEVIFNGDFAQLAEEREREGTLNALWKRMTRLQHEAFSLPAGWSYYQSLTGKSKAFVTLVERNGTRALRLEADGYLAAFPKPFEVKEEKIFSFTVYAEKDSMLQFTRAGQEIGMLPLLLLPLKAGTTRRYEIKLVPYAECEQNEIWFWLDRGVVELSDVRLR